ncbi:MAG: BrnA antitoxin family protein [Anaerolineales bacterium]
MSESNMKNFSKTNWHQIDALPDDQIDTSDIPPLSASFFERATWRKPRPPIEVTLHLDPDLIAWFKAQDGEYEQRINAALRIYAEAHKAYGG